MKKNSEFEILIVDDDTDLLRSMEKLIKEEHYAVRTADCGQGCLDAIGQRKPDLLLLDVMLPDMSGMDVCRKIKLDKNFSSIHVLLLSGFKIQSENISEGLETGADGYLIKPLKNRELLARIDAAFRIIRAELALQETNARFQLMADTAPVLIWQSGTDAQCDYFNQPWLSFTGRTLEQEVGYGWAEGVHPSDIEACLEIYHVSFKARRKFNMEFRLRNAVGEYHWVLYSGVPRFTPDGSFAGYIGSCVDITKVRHVEETLNNLSQAVEQSPVSIVITDVKGDIEYGNPTVFKLTGYKPEELLGQNPRIFKSGETTTAEYRNLWETIRSGHEWKGAFHNKKKNGELYWESASISPVKNANGEIIHFLAIKEDITERLEAESKIRKLNETLEQRVAERTNQLLTINKELAFKNQEWEQFTFITSHDLQEPLLTLTNFTKIIQQEYTGKLDADGDKCIEFISSSANRMSILIKGLLDYSLLGKESVLTMVDCNKLVGEVLAELSGTITETGAVIILRELPAFHGFEREIKILFHHLVDNAIKFRKTNVPPEIKISATSNEKEIVFSITDNGIGLEENNREKIFTIFKQMHNRTDYQGTGIGLAHCKKIVELHGGKIWVESKPGAGSSFFFSIPGN